MNPFRLLEFKIEEVVGEALRRAFAPVAPYLRRLLTGIGLALFAVISFLGILGGLTMALFFALSDLPYAVPALWVSLVWALLSLLFALLSTFFLRAPRR